MFGKRQTFGGNTPGIQTPAVSRPQPAVPAAGSAAQQRADAASRAVGLPSELSGRTAGGEIVASRTGTRGTSAGRPLGNGGVEFSALPLDVFWAIVVSVLVFLGIPLLAGFLTRTLGERARGREWYETRVLPAISPIALYGLLFTIVMLFALQGDAITSNPWDVARIALPLLAYFAIMFGGSFLLGRRLGLGYPRTATLAFTAAGNNFELAIAVAIGVFGVTSGQALAGVVGPLIEVPVLVGLVYVALWARRRFYGDDTATLSGARP